MTEPTYRTGCFVNLPHRTAIRCDSFSIERTLYWRNYVTVTTGCNLWINNVMIVFDNRYFLDGRISRLRSKWNVLGFFIDTFFHLDIMSAIFPITSFPPTPRKNVFIFHILLDFFMYYTNNNILRKYLFFILEKF